MTIGERIKKIRLEKGMTQKELAEKCGLFDSAIRRYESGRQNPKIGTVQKIAMALDVNIGELIEITEKDKQRGYVKATAKVELTGKDNEMVGKYLALNEDGRQKVQVYVSDLCEIDKYLNNPFAFRKNQKIEMQERLNQSQPDNED